MLFLLENLFYTFVCGLDSDAHFSAQPALRD